ncbi:TraX family protein [Massilia sp. erpn]|uniref:TraX family protein n=1 Tax=Massilia sp. erpn TaxID=2738142 RepID=UPI0021032B77|nr:TraX family protein [Massilia sp. erpn]UTY59664.1 conjugal transfer protein TraX [Massilia sp. erpn]
MYRPDGWSGAVQAGQRMAGRPARSLHIADGTLEALKWLALMAMTLDHVNTYLWQGHWPVLYAIGRVAMPIFAFILAYRLAQPQAIVLGLPHRVVWRLAAAGICAAPLCFGLVRQENGWWPLNIMFTLCIGTVIVWLISSGGKWRPALALALFVFCGPLLEFWWFGLACFLGAWYFCRHPGWPSLLAWLAGCASLYAINGNHWAMAAMVPLVASPLLSLRLPRARYFFYAYYPGHLAVLLVLRSTGMA